MVIANHAWDAYFISSQFQVEHILVSSYDCFILQEVITKTYVMTFHSVVCMRIIYLATRHQEDLELVNVMMKSCITLTAWTMYAGNVST